MLEYARTCQGCGVKKKVLERSHMTPLFQFATSFTGTITNMWKKVLWSDNIFRHDYILGKTDNKCNSEHIIHMVKYDNSMVNLAK